MSAELVFGIRVKLDDGIDPVAICEKYQRVQGQEEYRAMADQVFEAKPDGFEVVWPTKKKPWPVDSAGFTFVPLCVTYTNEVHVKLVDQLCDARETIQRLRDLAKQML